MKKTAIVIYTMALVFALVGCGTKNEKSTEMVQQEGAMETTSAEVPIGEGIPAGMPPLMGQGEGMPAGMPPGMGQGAGMPPGMGQGAGMPPGMGQGSAAQRETVIPDSVRKKWVASKILVKKVGDEGEGTVYEIAEGESVQIPESDLRVKVGHYLPDFSMGPGMITSKSDEPNQPTVKITVFEKEEEIYSGWAFEKIPEAHAFTHPEYSVILVGGVAAE